MIRRFIDRRDSMSMLKESEGFSTRIHGPRIWIVLIICVLSALTVGMFFFDFAYKSPLATNIIFSLLMAVFAFYIGGCFYRIYKRITLVEFQNLLFASAARANTEFFLILYKDHRIIYCDYKYFDLLAQNAVLDIEQFTRQGWLTHEDVKKILNAMEESTSVKVQMASIGPDGEVGEGKLMLELVPLYRPKGFFVLRAAQ